MKRRAGTAKLVPGSPVVGLLLVNLAWPISVGQAQEAWVGGAGDKLGFRAELTPAEFVANLRVDHLAALALFDWHPECQLASIDRVDPHFLRKMQGAMLLALSDHWFVQPTTYTLLPVTELNYLGVRKDKGGCIATRIIQRRPDTYMQVMYFPGSYLALRLQLLGPLPFPNDPNNTDFKNYLLQQLLPEALRIPYRAPDAVEMDCEEQKIAGIKVFSGRIKLGKPPISAVGADSDVLTRDSLFDAVSFILVDSEPAYLGLVVYLPDPDKTKWCKQPIVIREK